MMNRKQVKALLQELLNEGATVRDEGRRQTRSASGPAPREREIGAGGPRVAYVVAKRVDPEDLSPREAEVLGVIKRKGQATAAALMSALKVNRNVIAGAVWNLKQLKAITTEALVGAGGGRAAVAAEHAPRRRRGRPRKTGK